VRSMVGPRVRLANLLTVQSHAFGPVGGSFLCLDAIGGFLSRQFCVGILPSTGGY